MVGRTGYCLLFILISLVETATSQEDLFTSKNYGCKTLYNFTSDVINAVFTHTIDGTIYENATSSHFPVVITTPANSSIPLSIEITNSTGTFTKYVLQNSSEICCNDRVNASKNCFLFNLTCPRQCAVSQWPNYPDFYKTNNCNLCSCQYCYLGSKIGWHQVSVSIYGGSQQHLFNLKLPLVEKNTTEIIQPKSKFLQFYRLPSTPNTDLLPIPKDGLLKYFTISPAKGTFDIRPINRTSLPDNGLMKLYFHLNTKKDFHVMVYDIRWYSKLKCSLSARNIRFFNDPLLDMNCNNAIQKPIIYSVSNVRFQMKENSLYFKELVTGLNTNMELSAMYAGLKDSLFQITIRPGLKVNQAFLTMFGCKAVINFGFLNYTSLSLVGLGSNITLFTTPNQYVINLPPNKTTIIEIYPKTGNFIMPFQITANASEICCNDTIKTLRLPICFSVKLGCPQSCQVKSWPQNEEFYNISNCENCSCQYCYIGSGTGNRQLMIPLKTYNHMIEVNIPSLKATKIEIKKSRSFFLTNSNRFPKDYDFTFLPVRNSNFSGYFHMVFRNGTAFLQVKDENTFPLNGRVLIYAYPRQFNNSKGLQIFNISWYSPPKCNFASLPWNFLNFPQIKMNCENFLQQPIEYSINNTKFQMKNNDLYLKELTITGTFIVTATAMYKGLRDSTASYIIGLNVPKRNVSILTMPKCKATFNFGLLNYSSLSLYHQQDGRNITLLRSSSNRNYDTQLPSNKTIIFNLQVNGDMEYTITAVSPEICCNHKLVKTYNCYQMELTCQTTCVTAEWPEFSYLYKTSDCNNCSCQYCYIGNISTEYKLAIPVRTSIYRLPINVTRVEITSIVLRKPRKEFLTAVELPNTTFVHLLSNPKEVGKYFRIVKRNLVYLQPRNNTILPSSGKINIYFQPIQLFQKNFHKVIEYTVVWFSKIECNVNYTRFQYRNDPVFYLYCQNHPQRKIIYNISGPFLLKGNAVYFDWTSTGDLNMSITAMYEGLRESARTFKLRFGLGHPAIITLINCKAVFRFGLLKYRSLNLYSQRLGLNVTLSNTKDYVVNLPSNKTITFNLKVDNDMEYTMTTVSPEYCCNASRTDVVKDLCFNVTLTCPVACPVSVWPEFIDFYKFSECKGCKCSYCYNGKGKKNISLSIPMKKDHYQLLFFQPEINKFLKPRRVSHQQLLSNFQFKTPLATNYSIRNLPHPWDSYFHDFFTMVVSPRALTLQLKKDKIPPKDGYIRVFYYERSTPISLGEYYLSWYSLPHCNVSYLHRNFLNNPLLSLDCENTVQKTIVFYPSNDKFQMKDNLMYPKDLTTYGTFNFSIIAMYEGFNETATNVKVSITLKENSTFVNVYGCKVILDRRFIEGNFRIGIINTSRLLLSANQHHIILTVPERYKIRLNIEPGNQNVTFTFSVTPSKQCCQDTITRSGLCFNFTLNCNGWCPLVTWPEFPNFSKSSPCGRCYCTYCSEISLNKQQLLLLPLNKSSTHLLIVGPILIKKNLIKLIRPRKELMNFDLKRSPQVLLFFPFNSYFTALYTNNTVYIQSNNLSSNGQQEMHLQRQVKNRTVIDEYKIVWYSPPLCQVTRFSAIYLNSPLAKLNCTGNSQIPIAYSLNNRNFQMKDIFIYQKDLALKSVYNVSITAMYEGLNDSMNNIATTIRVPLNVNGRHVFSRQNCNTTIGTNLLEYNSLDILIKTRQYNKTVTITSKNYTIDLPSNERVKFYFTPQNQNMTFTLTVKTDYCCRQNITHHNSFSCYTLKLECPKACLGIYPETQLLYKIPGSSKCSIIYCYKGGNIRRVNMSVPLQENEHNYTVELPNTSRKVEIVEFLIGWKEKQLNNSRYFKFQVWPQKYMPYVRKTYRGGVPLLSLVTNKTFSPEGKFHLMLSQNQYPGYIQNQYPGYIQRIQEFRVYAFKKVHCNVVKVDHKQNMWPLPMYLFNCTNALNMPLKYNMIITDSKNFSFKQPKLYMVSPPYVNTTISVEVSYVNFNSSVSVHNVSITLKEYFMSGKKPENVESRSVANSIKTLVNVKNVTSRPGNILDFVIHVPSIMAIKTLIELKTKLTILEYYASVGQLYITNLTAVQESKNRFVFTCHTDSTFTDLTYKWYWNKNEITNDISSSMKNGKSQGRIIINGLNENDSGNVTCHVTKKDFIPATLMRSIHMDFFPVVKLDATYHIIQNNKKPVNVTCMSFSKISSPKLIFKVNNRQIENTKVTLTEESTVSCYGVYNGLKGEMKNLNILKAVGKTLCPANTYNNIKWPESIVNTAANVTCSEGYSGTISRFCSNNGNWELPDTSNCLKKAISDAKSKLDRIAIGLDKGFESAVENLAKATNQSIGAKDITETLDALKVISTITNKSKEVSKKEIKNVVNVVNNLIESDTKNAWTKLEDKSIEKKPESLREKNQLSAGASILKLTEDFGNVASQKVNETVSISTDNLLIEYEKVNVEENVHFPAKNTSQPDWVKERVSQVFVPSTILKNLFGANESVSMNAVIFRNMKEVLPQSKNSSSDLNSYVLSISFGKKLENLTENVVLGFTHLSPGYDEPSCNFWDFNSNPEFGGYWSTRGCKVTFSNSTNTECSCDHLTNFAILMNVVQHKDRKVLGIITKVGCSISIVALILTIIIYAVTWKSVTSQAVTKSQSILIMNLCVSLIISYLIFLTLVQGPREKNACTAIAALLHYFFLVVFCTMLAEGVDMAITLKVVFNPKFHRLPLLLVLSWVTPAIIVGVSLAITQTNGFGNEVFCWLTPESNVIWSFIIPALIIIVANIVCVIYIVKSLLSAYCMLRKNVKQRLRKGARAIGILTPLLGFTWIFGIFAVNEATVVFEYIFTIASSLQGLFIFIAYCIFNKQVHKGLSLLRGKRSQPLTKQSPLSTSGTKTTDLNSSAKCATKNSTSLFDVSELHSKPENSFDDSTLVFTDTGLYRPIMPYYVNEIMRSSLNDKDYL